MKDFKDLLPLGCKDGEIYDKDGNTLFTAHTNNGKIPLTDGEWFNLIATVTDAANDALNPDKISFKWSLSDVINRANETNNDTLTESEAREVLLNMEHHHDCNIGMSWEVMDIWIDQVMNDRIDLPQDSHLYVVEGYYKDDDKTPILDRPIVSIDESIPDNNDEVWHVVNGIEELDELIKLGEHTSNGFVITAYAPLLRPDGEPIYTVNDKNVCPICNLDKEDPTSPMGIFRNWIETHHEVVSMITSIINGVACSQSDTNILNKWIEDQQQGFKITYQLCIDITNAFEEKYKDRDWDGEYVEYVDEFITEYIQKLQ